MSIVGEMVTLELATRLEPFDPKIDTSVIGQRWKRWMRSFKLKVLLVSG